MKAEEKKRVASTITERSKWIRVGLLPIRIKPITFGQIYDIAEMAIQLRTEGINASKPSTRAFSDMLNNYDNLPLAREIFVRGVFRSRLMAKLFRRYICHRLTMEQYYQFITFLISSFDANFFLTSITFLHQTTKVTDTKQTIVRGQSSEE